MRKIWVCASAITKLSLVALPLPVIAQIPQATAMNVICAEEQASGFNWAKGRWLPVQYKSSDKIHIRRLTPSEVKKDVPNSFDRPIPCLGADLETVFDVSRFGENGRYARKACYSIKDFGKEALLSMSAELCTEEFNNGALEKIECKSMHFSPNGLFIRLPWYVAMDINPLPKNDYKDSLVIATGKCSALD